MQQRNWWLKTALALALCAAFLLSLIIPIGIYIKDQRYGLSLAPEVSHTQFADNESHVRLVINPDLLLEYIEHYLPEGLEVLGSGQSNLERISQLLPREIAMLARSDLPSDKIYLTLFANERRGGPRIQAWINSSNIFAKTPKVNWTSDGLELRGRGILVAEGVLTLPASLKETQQRLRPTHIQDRPTPIKGGYFAELVVDNINGDVFTLVNVVADFLGIDWGNILYFLVPPVDLSGGYLGPPSYKGVVEYASRVFGDINVIHVIADLKDENTMAMSVNISINTPEGREGMVFILSYLTFPQLGDWLKDNYNLVLDGSVQGGETENSIIGDYTLSGVQGYFKDAFEKGISWIDGSK